MIKVLLEYFTYVTRHHEDAYCQAATESKTEIMDIYHEHGWNPNPERSIRILKKYQKRQRRERYRRKLLKKYEKQPNGPFSSMREGCNQTADLCLGHGVKWVLEDGTADRYTVVCKQTYHHYSDFRS